MNLDFCRNDSLSTEYLAMSEGRTNADTEVTKFFVLIVCFLFDSFFDLEFPLPSYFIC